MSNDTPKIQLKNITKGELKSNSKRYISDEEHQKYIDTLDTYPYIIDKDNNFIGYIGKDKNSYYMDYCSTYCKIIRKIIDLDTKQVKIIYELNNGLEIVQVPLDGDTMSKFGLKTLISYGVRFADKKSDIMIDYLMYSDNQAEVVYGFRKLGWSHNGKNLVFKYNKMISQEPPDKKFIYSGSLDLSSRGSLEVWVEMVNKDVCCNLSMVFLLMASFASPLLALLNESHDFGSILFCLSNGSSRGKSTTAMLCASVYSSPVLNRGVAVSFNGTENALQEFLSQINGLSVVFDELGVSTISNLERVLYSFCLGRSKL